MFYNPNTLRNIAVSLVVVSQLSSTPDPTLGRRFCPENPYDSKLNTVRNKNSLSLTFAQEERLLKERLEAPVEERFRTLISFHLYFLIQ